MAELRPYPFAGLVTRMFRELEAKQSIFDLPAKKFFLGDRDLDLSVPFHAQRAATPLGPAAGPQTQMAQNIVLAWLGGCRILELKTVQILDELEIGRPCIDMQNVGYNIEWSQELKLEESLEEYVKGAMLVEMLRASDKLELAPGFERVIYDMSVGYDLKGIQDPRVQQFLQGMLDCSAVVERLRSQIPDEFAAYRDLEYPTKLSDTLTLSTFHGCPPDEIEGIIDFLLRDLGIHCIIKCNPTLLGRERVAEILRGTLGYEDLRVPDAAFDKDTSWGQMVGFVERLRSTAQDRNLGLGVKFTNTLIVGNHRSFFPAAEKEMYLSGPPLHVIAMQLVDRMRQKFGDTVPISFSAGIDRQNFADSTSLGLVPITVCSDLLKPGGYGRAAGYLQDLTRRMRQVGAADVSEFVLRARDHGAQALDACSPDPQQREDALSALQDGRSLRTAVDAELFDRWVSEARVLNANSYAQQLIEDDRYALVKNTRVPPKIGSHLELFDCVTCDKCVPVCPNNANFTFPMVRDLIPRWSLIPGDSAWQRQDLDPLALEQRHQIGNYVDFCNDCGNCDVFCPEDGGPYNIKPRFFGSLSGWRHDGEARDGFYVGETQGVRIAAGRFGGAEYRINREPAGEVEYRGPGFELRFRQDDVTATCNGTAQGPVDMTYYEILCALQDSVAATGQVNYVSCRR